MRKKLDEPLPLAEQRRINRLRPRVVSFENARGMVRRGARCSVCGGRLFLVDDVDANEVEVACLLCSRPDCRVMLAPAMLEDGWVGGPADPDDPPLVAA